MKLRDASNVLRSVAAIHMRDAANVLRTAPTIHMRDAANALKTAYSSGPPPAVSVTPPSIATSSDNDFANASTFTASFSGGSPTSIVWSVEGMDNCTAHVIDGQGTASATIRIVVNDGGFDVITGSCTVRCTAVIAGVARTGSAFKSHSFYYGGGKFL